MQCHYLKPSNTQTHSSKQAQSKAQFSEESLGTSAKNKGHPRKVNMSEIKPVGCATNQTLAIKPEYLFTVGSTLDFYCQKVVLLSYPYEMNYLRNIYKCMALPANHYKASRKMHIWAQDHRLLMSYFTHQVRSDLQASNHPCCSPRNKATNLESMDHLDK
jgi:hypothetical protein